MSDKDIKFKKVAFFDHECSGEDEEISLIKNSKNVIYSFNLKLA